MYSKSASFLTLKNQNRVRAEESLLRTQDINAKRTIGTRKTGGTASATTQAFVQTSVQEGYVVTTQNQEALLLSVNLGLPEQIQLFSKYVSEGIPQSIESELLVQPLLTDPLTMVEQLTQGTPAPAPPPPDPTDNSEFLEYEDVEQTIVTGLSAGFPSGGKLGIPDGVRIIRNQALYNKPISELYLPRTLELLDGQECFAQQNLGESLLTAVHFSEAPTPGLTTLGVRTFRRCDVLANVYNISSLVNLTTIGDRVFSTCSSLTSFDFSALPSLQSIGIVTFTSTGLTSINLSSNVQLTTIGENTFQQCLQLSSITFSPALQTIGTYTFYGCTFLTSVSFTGLPELQSIGTQTFYGCTGLTSVSFTGLSALQTIGTYTFYGCTGLTSVSFTELPALQSIGDYTFEGCTGIQSVSFTNLAVFQSIGDVTFLNCSSLLTITFSNLSSIIRLDTNQNPFAGCTNIQSISFSNLAALQEIGNGNSTFSTLTNLTSVTFSNCPSLQSIGNVTFANCTSLASIDLSPLTGLTSIGTSTFRECTSLAYVKLPNSLTSFGGSIFLNCTSLARVDTELTANQINLSALDNGVFKGTSLSLLYLPNMTTYGTNSLGDILVPLTIHLKSDSITYPDPPSSALGTTSLTIVRDIPA